MTERASQIQESKPEEIKGSPKATPGDHAIAGIIDAEPFCREPVGGVLNGGEAAAALQQSEVLHGFGALPDSGFSFGMIGIIVILMDGHDRGRRISN